MYSRKSLAVSTREYNLDEQVEIRSQLFNGPYQYVHGIYWWKIGMIIFTEFIGS